MIGYFFLFPIPNLLNEKGGNNGYYRNYSTLSQFTPFYEAFNTQPGDPVYIAPDQHVVIW